MTHSLHRYGTEQSLENDYTFIGRAIKREGFEANLQKVFEIILSEGPENIGCSSLQKSSAAGVDPKDIAASFNKTLRFACSFSSKEKVKRVLKKLKEADAGVSIVIGGLIKEIMEMSKENGLTPHTANISLGIFGRKKTLLPEDDVLCITTMCGHGMISAKLSKTVMEKVKSGKLSPKEGSRLLARNCPCGLLNLTRCEDLFALSEKNFVRSTEL
jgi:hypothetical protein